MAQLNSEGTCLPLLPEMQISQSSNGHFLLVFEFIKPILLQPFSGGTIHFHTCIILFSCDRRTPSTCAHNFLQLRKFLSYKKSLLKIRVIQLHHVPQCCSSAWKQSLKHSLGNKVDNRWQTDWVHLCEVFRRCTFRFSGAFQHIKTAHTPPKYLFVIKGGE